MRKAMLIMAPALWAFIAGWNFGNEHLPQHMLVGFVALTAMALNLLGAFVLLARPPQETP